MRTMRILPALLVVAALLAAPAALAQQPKPAGKPQLSVRASPNTGFVPFRSVFTAELTGGTVCDGQTKEARANDYKVCHEISASECCAELDGGVFTLPGLMVATRSAS